MFSSRSEKKKRKLAETFLVYEIINYTYTLFIFIFIYTCLFFGLRSKTIKQ